MTMTHSGGGLVYGASCTFEFPRSSLVGRRAKDDSLNDFFALLDVAFPARFLEKLSVGFPRELNMMLRGQQGDQQIYHPTDLLGNTFPQ